jgi:glycosyltransferase involved in cell wall biosynthesis
LKITVFTPTYNRGFIIENLYRSLQKQTYTNFEWLVIDDGSEDNTKQLFEVWKTENNKFPISYYRVENGGKHRAVNKATDLAKGELLFIVDSDDYLTEDALESIVKWDNSLEDKEQFCGIAGNKGKINNGIWGTTFIGDFIDATSLERDKYNITGDKAEVFFTEILRRYKFDEFEGENFITERTVWDRMAYDGYRIRWFNKIIYLCDYLADGLTKSGDQIFSKNPRGTACLVKQQIKFNKYKLKDRLSNYYAYYELTKGNLDFKKAAEYLEIKPINLIFAIFLGRCKKVLSNVSKYFSLHISAR